MISENFNNKLKIFVRYPGGASGHFISLLLLNLVTDIKLVESFRGHRNIQHINNGHNFHQQWTDEFRKHTEENIDLNKSIKYIKEKFYFCPIPTDFYVVHTHALNPDPLILAFDNTKLINVKNNDDDLDQLAYNWVTKSVLLYDYQFESLNRRLEKIKKNYNRLLDIPYVDKKSDVKLLTYIVRYTMDCRFNTIKFTQPLGVRYSIFNLNFKDIASKAIANQLDAIIDFLEIKVCTERKATTIQMINEYADAQTVVPWKLNLEDYD